MIPQNELRIGNFVFDDENTECKTSCLFSDKKIQYEGYDMDDFQVEYENNNNIYLSSVINPIQLTEEWLIKFGFSKNIRLDCGGYKRTDVWSNFSFSITIWEDGRLFYDWMGGNIELKYVHQLQNVYFALTGNELSFA